MTNKHRGEVPLKLGGKDLILRASVDGMARWEEALGYGGFVVLKNMRDTNFSFKEIAITLWAGLLGGDDEMKLDEVKQLVFDQGFMEFLQPFTLLVREFAGPAPKDKTTQEDDEEGKTEAQPTKKLKLSR